MAYSAQSLEDIRKALMETIASVKRENETLTAKIDSLKDLQDSSSDPHLESPEDKKFLEELRLTENIHGIAFRNVYKEMLPDSTMHITADVIHGKEKCHLELRADVDWKVKNFSLHIDETSSLNEIKHYISSFIGCGNLSYTLKAIASFTRMDDVRSQIFEDLLKHYEEFFRLEVGFEEVSHGGTTLDAFVVSAASRSRRHKYFEVTWILRWNTGKMCIEHGFIVKREKGILKIPRLEPELRKLVDKQFVDGQCSELFDLWRDIGKLVSER